MNFQTAIAFGEAFHNCRINIFYCLCVSEELLDILQEKGALTPEERYSIFSSPLPTVFRNGSRIAKLLQILDRNWQYLSILELLQQFSSQSDSVKELLHHLYTEFSNFPVLHQFIPDFNQDKDR